MKKIMLRFLRNHIIRVLSRKMGDQLINNILSDLELNELSDNEFQLRRFEDTYGKNSQITKMCKNNEFTFK